VSIGHDISVDSAELDKCDFVELVRPNSVALKPLEVGKSGGAVFKDGVAAAKADPTDTLDALLSKPKSAGAADSSSPAAEAGSASGGTGAAAASAPRAAAAKAKDDEDDYGEESFEDNASVPESIEESVGSGSDAWGNGEDV